MRFGPVRVPVAAYRLGRDLTLGPVPGVPTDRAGLSDAEPLRCSPARGTGLDSGNHPLAQVQRQGSGHGAPP